MSDKLQKGKMETQNVLIDDLRRENVRLKSEIEDVTKTNSELLQQVRRLEFELRSERKVWFPTKTPWTPEDAVKCETTPSWRYLKPFQNAIKQLRTQCPGLETAVAEAMKVEMEHGDDTIYRRAGYVDEEEQVDYLMEKYRLFRVPQEKVMRDKQTQYDPFFNKQSIGVQTNRENVRSPSYEWPIESSRCFSPTPVNIDLMTNIDREPVEVANLIDLVEIIEEFDPINPNMAEKPNIADSESNEVDESDDDRNVSEARAMTYDDPPKSPNSELGSEGNPSPKPNTGTKPKVIRSRVKTSRGERYRAGCWYCGALDHRYPSCPETFTKPFCFHCGLPGFKSGNCPGCQHSRQ